MGGDSHTVDLGSPGQSSTDPVDEGNTSNGYQEPKLDNVENGKVHYNAKTGVTLEEGESSEEPKGNFCGYFEIFKFASCLDIALFIIGLLAAVINGCCFPAMVYFMSDLMEEMLVPYQAKSPSGTTPSPTDGSSTLSSEETQDQMMEKFEDSVNKICAQIAIVGLVAFITSYLQIALVTIAGENILHRVRKRSFKAILRQDIGWFDQQQTGKLVTRLTDDLEKIRQGVSDKISICFQYASSFVVAYVLAFTFGPKLAAVMCAILPLMVFCGVGYVRYTVTAASEEQEKHGEAGTIAQRTFSAIRTVVSFGGEYKEIKEYNGKLKEAKKLEFKQIFLAGSFFGGIYGALFLTYSSAFWYGPKEVINGNMTTMEVFTVLFTVVVGSMSVAQAGPVVGLVTSGAASYQFLKSIIKRVPPIDSESTSGVTLQNLRGQISFSNVSFSYPTRSSVKVLKDFTLNIEPNQTVALVGSSGSGKSTIVNILQRFYPLKEGTVTIDGVDIETLNVKWLRDQIGIVSQEPILFGCSIRENIEYGRDDVTAEEIERAIDEANAREFISKLPQGLDTLVGDRGSQLSGGQKQRVAIARALVRNPKILLLDEATSALDSNSERIVQEALDKARHGRTTIVVAHRLSTIKDSDTIIVMKNGVMAEVGTHDQLLSLNKVYADMIFHQSLSEKEDSEFQQFEKEHEELLATNAEEENKEKTEEATQPETKLPGFVDILKLNLPEISFILVACVASLIASSVMPVFSIFVAEILEVFALPADEMESEANFWALMMAGIGIISFVSAIIESWALGISGSRLTERLRSQSFKSMIRQDMSYHDDLANHSGILTARLARETSLVQGATGIKLKTTLDAIGTMAVGMGIAFYFGWQLALLLILASPLTAVAGAVQLKFATGFQVKEENDSQGAGKITSEAISNIRTVQGLGLEGKMFNKFYDSLVAAHRSNFKTAHVYGIAQSFATSLSFFLFSAAFWFSVWLIKNDWMGSTDSFRVIFALVMAAMVVGQATGRVPDFAKAQLATKSLLDLFNLIPKIDNLDESGLQSWNSNEEQTEEGVVHIEFKDIHFRYPSRPDAKVMSGFSLKVMKGKTVAFVGPSGCGKSTVMQLIQRFYDPEQGSVEIDGSDIKTLNVRQLRRQMAIVSQEPSLFDDSIYNNMRYGALTDAGDYDESVQHDDILNAAKDANLPEFVLTQFSQGYDTNVGERGTQISGGQKQRIAIARALVRNPSILILDEATSALDSESEKVVQQALDVARQGRTCLMIAHRLTTVQNADEIVVMEHGGHIVQRGTHEQLLRNPQGLYFKLCQAQSLST